MRVSAWVVLVFHLAVSSGINEYQVKYVVYENSVSKTTIGSLPTDLSHQFYQNKRLFQSTQVKYKFSKENKYFLLNEKSGTISLKFIIDLEEICEKGDAICNNNGSPYMTYVINVWDDNQFIAIIKTIFSIEDENDNFPVFPSKFTTKRISEVNLQKDRKIYLPQAIDNDVSEKNRKIIYELKQNDEEYFRLSVESKTEKPFVTLLKGLDAEADENHTIILEAWNEGYLEKKSEIVIYFEILDFNDNEPYFNASKFTVTIPENTAVSTNIYKIEAFDPDKTAKLSYRLDNSVKISIKRLFVIQEDGWVVLIRGLDYETDQMHSFLVEVYDGVFAASVTIIVKVIDINDEIPTIQIYPSKLFLPENILSGASVGQIKITDRDSPEVNGKIYCQEPETMNNIQPFTFHPDPSVVQDSKIYEIKSRLTFDREELVNNEKVIPIRMAILICSDGHGRNNGQLTATFTISVTIEDVNDNEPLFTESMYHTVVWENNHINANVFQVFATDKDEGQNAQITYEIVDSNDFKMDSLSGIIVATKVFDREEVDHYMVTIKAYDHGNPAFTTSAKVNITIGDRNDNSPQLISSNKLNIEENRSPTNGPIGYLKAKDNDIGLNGAIKFELMWPNDGYFDITSNGTLFAKIAFDREVKDNYCIRVKISDLGTENQQQTVTAICITILDLNDNAPQFIEPSNLLSRDNIAGPTNSPIIPIDLSIYEIPGELIVKVQAKDQDVDRNGLIHYSLKIPLGLPRLFEIDRNDGEVKVSQTLSRSDIGFYRVHVIASDNGSPPLSDIKVLPINVVDKPPGFGKEKTKEGIGAKTWQFFGTANNILIVVVLSGVSAILVVVLITAISCMLNPCKNQNSHMFSRGQRYDTSFDNQSKNVDHINDLELMSSIDKQYGDFHGNIPDEFENRTLIIPSSLYEQTACRIYSSPSIKERNFHVWSTTDNMIGLNSNRGVVRDSGASVHPEINLNNLQSFSLNRMGNRSTPFCIHNRCVSPYNSNNDTFLSTINDEHQSDSGRGGSDDDIVMSLANNGRANLVNGIKKINHFQPKIIHSLNKQSETVKDSLTTVGEERETQNASDDHLNRSILADNEKEDLTLLCDKINDLFFNNVA